MNGIAGLTMPAWLSGPNSKALAAPLLIIMMLAMMVLPLPAFVLELNVASTRVVARLWPQRRPAPAAADGAGGAGGDGSAECFGNDQDLRWPAAC